MNVAGLLDTVTQGERMRSVMLGAALAIGTLASQASAQAQVTAAGDTIILLVTSPRGHEVLFSGTITLREAMTEKKLENVRTPFEIRLPIQPIEASFTAVDGGALGGEIHPFRDGKPRGHAIGTTWTAAAPLHLFYRPGFGWGFGNPELARTRIP